MLIVLRFEDWEGSLIFETMEVILDLAGVQTQTSWFQGFLGVTREATILGDYSKGRAQWNGGDEMVILEDAGGKEGARIRFEQSGSGPGLVISVMVDANAAGPDEVRFRFACGP
ncbi:MAG: hypothetical protein ISR64_06660 [Deltaproteobacteria bacterium]|nr:hypothetical protein [Deltaproteobacteria bacterium]